MVHTCSQLTTDDWRFAVPHRLPPMPTAECDVADAAAAAAAAVDDKRLPHGSAQTAASAWETL